MLKIISGAAVALAVSAGGAAAQYYAPTAPGPHGCAEPAHSPHAGCYCNQEQVFYTPAPGAPWHINHPGGPAVRVYSQPVYVPSGRVDIQGPPIYVEAPPIRVAPAQIYLHAPDVRVKPSQVIVEPPQIHAAPCPDGRVCGPVGANP